MNFPVNWGLREDRINHMLLTILKMYVILEVVKSNNTLHKLQKVILK